jgi:hypothetical protein
MNIFAENSLQMAIYKTYIQQLSYDGTDYTKGSVVDLLTAYKIICQDFPFKKNPKPKDLPTRDWAGEDGLDVYVPDKIPMKSYDIDVTFLYVGTEQSIRTDISNFLDFICGRIKADNSDTVKSGRLAIYNEYVGMGRKDVVVNEIDNEIYYVTDCDPDAVAKIKVKFTVYDPTTEVTATETTVGNVTSVSNLSFS